MVVGLFWFPGKSLRFTDGDIPPVRGEELEIELSCVEECSEKVFFTVAADNLFASAHLRHPVTCFAFGADYERGLGWRYFCSGLFVC